MIDIVFYVAFVIIYNKLYSEYSNIYKEQRKNNNNLQQQNFKV